MYTGLEVFKLSSDLIDETLATGAINGATTGIYKARATGILNLWQSEMSIELLVPTPDTLESLDDVLVIDYPNCAAYFLSAHLLLVEDAASASFFNQRFEELKIKILSNRPVLATQIIDVYQCYDYNVAHEIGRAHV